MKNGNLFTKDVELDLSRLSPTRIHALQDFWGSGRHAWLKRDDELSGFISAGKLRKYASLLPAIRREGYDAVLLEGGINSNHILAAAQILIEANIQAIPVVRESHHWGTNAHLLSLLVPKEHWLVLTGAEWADRGKSIEKEVLRMESLGRNPFYLPEGAFVEEALLGTTVLAGEILMQSEELGLDFQHIYIDAGTCLSAFGLALGMASAGWAGKIHIVSMAAKEMEFRLRWKMVKEWAGLENEDLLQSAEELMQFHLPVTAARFGAQNGAIKSAIVRFASKYGVLTDPVYSAKLLMSAETLGLEIPENENVLIIHSGGGSALPGFLPF